ncbi:MAG: acyltransferase [Lachnospiraceae bacterium]|nr:acyltransferase [Lachnospiraceae bacterium]
MYRNKLKQLGKNFEFNFPICFRNPQYISIGNDCYLGTNCRIEAWDQYNDLDYRPEIVIGNSVKINSTCHIGAINKVIIGDNCLLGSYVMIIDHAHGKSNLQEAYIHPSKRDLYSKGCVKIGSFCWLCENVVVLPGVTIGKGTIVGANAVVTEDLPEYCVAVGNPAKVVKYLK